MPVRELAVTAVTDEILLGRYHDKGDQAALEQLIDRYRRFARAKARGYFLVGGDRDDVEQEALIGLYKAVRDFRHSHKVSFRAFADLCIRRQIITAIKSATRQKHQPLNSYLSIWGNRPEDDTSGESNAVETIIIGAEDDPCETVVAEERLAGIHRSMAELLSPLEVDVLRLYVEGSSYQEIGDHLGRHAKSVDNALQRIKRKLDGQLFDDADELLAGVA